MNKKICLLLSLVFVMVASMAIFASTKTTIKEFTAKVDFKAPVLTHTPITNVSSISKKLKAGVVVDFGMFSYATAEAQLIYYYNSDESSKVPVSYNGTIKNNEQFFIETNVENNDTINYQIKVDFYNAAGVLSKTLYSPEDASFYTATISNSASGTIDETGGGNVVYDNGNQETGNSGVNFQPGTFEPGTEIIIEELDFGGASPVSGLRKASKAPAMSSAYGKFGDSPINGIGVSTKDGQKTWSPAAEGYIDLKGATGTKFTVVWREDASADINTWEVINVKEIKGGSVYFDVSKAGQYLVFSDNKLAIKTHRPERRTIVKGRIGTKYPGFEFPNLVEGDVVKIFSVNGKKIAEVSGVSGDNSGKIVWDGRKDNGDWAKSGIYIYQIKIKETGKLISGTIVFVY